MYFYSNYNYMKDNSIQKYLLYMPIQIYLYKKNITEFNKGVQIFYNLIVLKNFAVP